MSEYKILISKPELGYELLDSGNNEKLERYGNVIISRPDPQALWQKNLSSGEWQKASARFLLKGEKGEWRIKRNILNKWPIEFSGLKFFIKPTPFKHTGLFPEQASNWKWLREKIEIAGRPISVLNLFGYTGGATLACASSGASVVHVDSSRSAVSWARENAEISDLSGKPIRWILDDAVKFVEKEIRRGNKYDGLILDPPAFGHGPNKEIWKIEKDFTNLVLNLEKIISSHPLFVLLSGYAAGYSAIAYENNLEIFKKSFGGVIEKGELAIMEKGSERLLPCGIFARWSLL
ncbi:MAG: class I SAM-dependent methyltransferase [Candidatus Pacebacteria bacterium]|nr:class I SAM-dependent methyltransferase [Candidatus Paceibacterota bacterium]